MKSIIVSLLSIFALSIFTSCTYVDRRPSPTSTSTTTSEVTPTTYGSVQTKTTRSY